MTNTDATLPTSNQGGVAGDYDYTIDTTAGEADEHDQPALELVPDDDDRGGGAGADRRRHRRRRASTPASR